MIAHATCRGFPNDLSLSLSLWGLVNSKSFIFSAYNECMFHLFLSLSLSLFAATRYTQHQLLIEYKNHKSSSTATTIKTKQAARTTAAIELQAAEEFALIIRRVSRIRSIISLCPNCHRYVCQKAAQCAAHLTRVEYQAVTSYNSVPLSIDRLRSSPYAPPQKPKTFYFSFFLPFWLRFLICSA